MEREPVSRAKRRIFRMLLLTGSLVFSLFLVEIVFRLFVPVTDIPLQFWDPIVGLRKSPNQSGRHIRGTVRSRYHFNAQGWNYPSDFSFARPPHASRVVLIGDSYVEALQVDCDKQMAVKLESYLSTPDRPMQCYPFGMSGYGTAQEYQLLCHYVLDYAPDVVIFFFTSNDVYDCSPYLSAVDSFYARYLLDDRGELERMPMTSWEPSSVRRWAAHSALARYLFLQQRLFDRPEPKGPTGITLRESAGTSADFSGRDLSPDERGRMSWMLIEKLLAAANAQCRSKGAALLLVYRGNVREIDAAEDGRLYEPPPKETDPWCLNDRLFEMGRDKLAPMADRLGIAYLDLTTPLVTAVRESGRPHNFPDDDHYNELGHDIAAREMSKMAQRWLDQSKASGVESGSSN